MTAKGSGMANTKKTLKITLSNKADDECQLLDEQWTAVKVNTFNQSMLLQMK